MSIVRKTGSAAAELNSPEKKALKKNAAAVFNALSLHGDDNDMIDHLINFGRC